MKLFVWSIKNFHELRFRKPFVRVYLAWALHKIPPMALSDLILGRRLKLDEVERMVPELEGVSLGRAIYRVECAVERAKKRLWRLWWDCYGKWFRFWLRVLIRPWRRLKGRIRRKVDTVSAFVNKLRGKTNDKSK